MYIGLTRDQIIDILSESGISKEAEVTAENLVEAIATLIVENNKLIKESTTDVVTEDLRRQMRGLF